MDKNKIKINITYGIKSPDIMDLKDEISELDSANYDIEIIEFRQANSDEIKVEVKTECGSKKFVYDGRGKLKEAIEEIKCIL